MKFATDLMINTFGVAETTAGWLVAAIPYGTIVLTPLFGTLYDRYGHGARLMLGGLCVALGGRFAVGFSIVAQCGVCAGHHVVCGNSLLFGSLSLLAVGS